MEPGMPVFLQHHDIVALLDGEATVKRLVRRGRQIRLVPANPEHDPIQVTRESDFSILGRVVGIIRQYPEGDPRRGAGPGYD